MKVVSVNIAEIKTVSWRGKEIQTGIYKQPVDGPIELGITDVKGDHVVDRKYHGGLDKACYLYSTDCYSIWKAKFPMLDFEYGMFGENISVEGMNDSLMTIGDVYKIGEAKIQIAQPRQPCFKLGIRFSTQHILKDFIRSPYPGAYVRVLKAGKVQKGDQLELLEKHQDNISLLEVFQLLYHATEEDTPYIKELLSKQVIPDETKDGLRKRLENLK